MVRRLPIGHAGTRSLMPDASFDEFIGSLKSPVFIATTRRDDERAGCLVGFATQASIGPRRFLACLSVQNHTYRTALDADFLAVHLVPRAAIALARLFGGETSDDTNKFSRCEWQEGPHGVPILADCPNWLVGRIRERLDLGDHCGFLLDPEEVQFTGEADALTADRAGNIEAGHDP